MRVAYVCADFGIPLRGFKGASVHVREMVAALREHGHEVRLVSPNAGEGNPLPDGAELLEVASPPWLKKTRRLIGRAVGEAWPRLPKEAEELIFNGPLYRRALVELDRFAPDVVYERYSLFNLAGLALARRLRVPHLLEVNAPLRLERARTRGLALERAARAVERVLFGHSDGLFVVSRALRDYALERGADRARLFVLPNGVDTRRFRPGASVGAVRARLGIPGGAPVVGFAGSLKPWHGTDLLLEAFAAARRRHHEARLLIVGDGPEAEPLRSQARRLGLDGAALFTGAVPHDDVPELLAAMDIAVAPYRRVPDFYFSPLKLYEYMAAGLPTIASDAGDIAEVVREGENGLLVEPDDPAALGATLLRLLDDAPLRVRLGQAARHDAEGRDWGRNAAQVIRYATDRAGRTSVEPRRDP
jgi:glycosyltransferase involved in cell wall biosynthesis